MIRTAALLLLLAATAAAGPLLGPSVLESGAPSPLFGESDEPDPTEPGPPIRVRVEARFPDGSLETGTISARSGRWGTCGPSRTRRFLSDVDVEIACSDTAEGALSCIPDPIVRTAHEGLAADVRPFLLKGGAVGIEAVVQAGRFDEETPFVPLEGRMLGRIQLPRYRGAVAVVGGRVDPRSGLTAVLAGADGPIRVRFTAVAPAGAADPRRAGGEAPRPVEVDEESPTERTWRALAAPGVPLAGGAGPPAADARAVTVDLRLTAGGEEISRLVVPSLEGRTAIVRRGVDAMVVSDWDVEVGCYNQIGDPIVRPVFSGALARILPRLSPDGGGVLLRLDYRYASAEPGPPRGSGTVVTGILHHVRVVRADLDVELPLRVGETERLSAGAAPDGRPLVLEVTVRG